MHLTRNEMSSYSIAYNKLSLADKEVLEEKILEWQDSNGNRSLKVVENFKNEHFLNPNIMLEIMYFIIQRRYKPIKHILDELRTLIYNQYILKGGKINSTDYANITGFAIPGEVYKNYLMKAYKKYFNRDNRKLSKYISQLKDGVKDDEISGFLFKEEYKLIWMTWDDSNIKGNPWSFLQTSTIDEIRIVLGLNDSYAPPSVLLCEINTGDNKNDKLKLFKPTFCDADFYENFRPTDESFKLYGLTEPLAKKITVNGKELFFKRRPEGVTKSKHVTVRHLRAMRELTE